MQNDNMLPEGLSEREARKRAEEGLSNETVTQAGKSVKDIIISNTLTYFNFIFLIITVLLCIAGSFRNLTFLPVIIGNTLVGIFQEIRAKKTLDKMSLINSPHAEVIRDGIRKKIRSSSLVLGDTVIFSAGDQICADARVISGEVFANEALLTGEEDEIKKSVGDRLLSGSFIVSGECCAVLESVGKESYISKLTMQAKTVDTKEQSEMIRSINKIVKWMGIILIPIGSILFYQSFFIKHDSFSDSVVSMVAAIIGMIPEGLYLLTTAALALGTIRLAKKKVLLNDMKSIESLARVDILCVDKTGTITEPSMQVRTVIDAENFSEKDSEFNMEMLFNYINASIDKNSTMNALKSFLAENSENIQSFKTALEVKPFSSAYKYGTAAFENGTYILGAPEFVLKDKASDYSELTDKYVKKGYRVLCFARMNESNVSPLLFIILSNALRTGAQKTFRYFKEQGVTVKVISGDHPETVSEIARLAGIENYDSFIDATKLDTKEKIEKAALTYTVFGRVTPKQKQMLVKAMQKKNHTVAMTGDGVNDILALKDADCSIAMASGSEAVSQVAQVVLLDSDFSKMPSVVLEGRRVVNNVQRSASLFLVKNIFSLLLSILASVLLLSYPLEPTHISLISMFTIGIPGFLLALESNKNRIEGSFLKNVLRAALPAGLTDAIVVGSLTIFKHVFNLPKADVATASTLILSFVGFMILRRISLPFNKYRLGVFLINILGMVLTLFFIPNFFKVVMIPVTSIQLTILFSFAAESIFRALSVIIDKKPKLKKKNKSNKKRVK